MFSAKRWNMADKFVSDVCAEINYQDVRRFRQTTKKTAVKKEGGQVESTHQKEGGQSRQTSSEWHGFDF